MRRHARASSAGSIQGLGARRGLSGLVCLCVLGLVAFLGSSASPALAVDNCPNAFFRTGPSAGLPDCRAFELVSPPNAGPVRPTASTIVNTTDGEQQPLFAQSPSGDSVVFLSQGAALTGTLGTGFEDGYLATRDADGWTTRLTTPSAAESEQHTQGPTSPDHTYFPLRIFGGTYQRNNGSLLAQYGITNNVGELLGMPNGTWQPIAMGSLGTDIGSTSPPPQIKWMTANAGHIIFTSNMKLEPDAPDGGGVYDRSPEGPTYYVSQLPGGGSGGNTQFQGASQDGTAVAFSANPDSGNGTLYVRLNNTTTKEVARNNGVIVGKQLSCSGSGSGGATLAYQWLRNGDPIGGATSADYTTAAGDAGTEVQCQVTATVAGEGAGLSASSPPAIVAPWPTNPPKPNGNPSISGTPNVGQVLSCSNGSWANSTPPTFTYQWLRNGAPIASATADTYTLVGADEGTAVQCEVIGTADGAKAVAFSNNQLIEALPPTASADPAISNLTNPGDEATPAAGDQLSCSDGTWANSPTFTYQWLRNGAPIGGTTANTYTVATPADDGATLQCTVTATNADSVAQVLSKEAVADPQPGTTPPDLTTAGSVTGTPNVGNDLTCDPGTWENSPTFTYQWLRNGAPIASATTDTYTLVGADRSQSIQCQVTATNAGGSVVSTNASASDGARYVDPNPPSASSSTAPLNFDFSGVSAHGEYVYYTQGGGNFFPGAIYSFDTATGATTEITSATDALPSYISPDGSHAYFVSNTQIGGHGTAGQPNLYVWSRAGGTIDFVDTLDSADVTDLGDGATAQANLVSWNQYYWNENNQDRASGPANEVARTTPDGKVLVFESKAQLTAYDNAGHIEIYRYDADAHSTECISCAGAGPATGDAGLQVFSGGLSDPRPIDSLNPVPISDDGSTVFFESTEQLVGADTDNNRDVYEWKKGQGISLISVGTTNLDSFLYAATPDGKNVVFETYDRLLPQDETSAGALYDARVDGGFPPPESTVTEPCSGDACQGTPSAAPDTPGNATAQIVGQGNLTTKRCGKGRRSVVRNGKTVCVKAKKHKKHKKHHHRRANGNRRAAR